MTDLSRFTDQQILAKTIWGEARGGGVAGMQSVASVIVNRAKKPGWWGDDIRSICLKPYQFSCWLSNDPNLPKILAVDEANTQYAIAMEVAEQAINSTLTDTTNGATSYYAESMAEPPKWAVGKTPCAEIAGQLFFNDIA